MNSRPVVLVCFLLALPWDPARAQPFDREFTFDADELRIASLVGSAEIRGHSGRGFRVRVHVRGEDADAELIRFEESPGKRAELLVVFPTDKHRRYVYPPLGAESRSQFTPGKHDSDWLEQLLDLGHGGIEVRGKPFHDAIEVWADVEVEVPQGKTAAVHLGVGTLEANRVQGNLELDTHSGGIDVGDVRGDVRVDTGSGSVRADRVTGDLSIDTGSGSVDLTDVRGGKRVQVDTGSGSVHAKTIEARTLGIDTGSGSVEVQDAKVEELGVDTGSGGVDATRIEADGVSIDTGSGGVWLELVRMGRGSYLVDTGSGGIRLHLPRQISAAFQVDTGSGGISVDIEGVALGRKQKREARFTVGAGESRVRLETGSGSVRIVQAGSR